LRFQQQGGDLRDPLGIGSRRAPQPLRRGGLDLRLLLQDIDRQRDEHGTFRGVGCDLEGAAQHGCDFVGAFNLHAPFGDGRRHCDEVVAEHGIFEPHPRVLLAGGHHERRVCLQCAVERADAVAEPGRDMEVGDREAAARLRIKAGRADGDAFMQGHDVFDLRIGRQAVEQRRLGGSGIAEDMAHAVRHKGFHQHLATAHSVSSPIYLQRTIARTQHRPQAAAGAVPCRECIWTSMAICASPLPRPLCTIRVTRETESGTAWRGTALAS
jgi:hypothetical protein